VSQPPVLNQLMYCSYGGKQELNPGFQLIFKACRVVVRLRSRNVGYCVNLLVLTAQFCHAFDLIDSADSCLWTEVHELLETSSV
jgi:hypothetical protein